MYFLQCNCTLFFRILWIGLRDNSVQTVRLNSVKSTPSLSTPAISAASPMNGRTDTSKSSLQRPAYLYIVWAYDFTTVLTDVQSTLAAAKRDIAVTHPSLQLHPCIRNSRLDLMRNPISCFLWGRTSQRRNLDPHLLVSIGTLKSTSKTKRQLDRFVFLHYTTVIQCTVS